MNLALSFDDKKLTLEQLVNQDHYLAMIKMAESLDIFGLGKSKKEEIEDAKSEIRSFITDELDKALVRTRIKTMSPQRLIDTFNQFNHLAGIAKFDTASYMRTFKQKLNNLGLEYFESPTELSLLTNSDEISNQKGSDTNDSEQHQQQQQVLIDEYQSLITESLIKTDFKSQLSLTLKLRQIKKGLKKAGITDDKDFEAFEKYAKTEAIFKLTEMLKESLEERAVLSELKGPGYILVMKKLKHALRGLKRCGAPINKKALTEMKDQINSAIFAIVKAEYHKVEINLELVPDSVQLKKQRDTYLHILERLKKNLI